MNFGLKVKLEKNFKDYLKFYAYVTSWSSDKIAERDSTEQILMRRLKAMRTARFHRKYHDPPSMSRAFLR